MIESRAPWLEAFLFSGVVGLLYFLGAESILASYHGFLHTAVGEAVLRDGLLPENPYHAGEPLRYYTLYPTLGVLLGRLGMGPLGGFALLNMVAAFLFPLAFNALGKSFQISFFARRWAFLAVFFGFNALGWLSMPTWFGFEWAGAPPIALSISMTHLPLFGAWDARLQGFLPKFLNVSSFALALAPALFALAEVFSKNAQPRRLVLPAALALALNPLVGFWLGFLLCVYFSPLLWRRAWKEGIPWLFAGTGALLLSLPFLLPLFQAAPSGPNLTGQVAFQSEPWRNIVGANFLLILCALWGRRAWKAPQGAWVLCAVTTLLLALFLQLPWANEYKLPRLLALLLAFPVGVAASHLQASAHVLRWIPWLVLAGALPTTLLLSTAYVRWGEDVPQFPFQAQHGRLGIHAEAQPLIFPASLLLLEAEVSPDAALVLHAQHPGSRMSGGVVQGNALAPVLHHALFVDEPQIHNAEQDNLKARLDLVQAFFNSTDSLEHQEENLFQMLEEVTPQSLLILTPPNFPSQFFQGLKSGKNFLPPQRLGQEAGFSLWWISPLPE